MENYLITHGIPALFIISFLAATVLPLGSEWLLVALILNDCNLEQAVIVASIGNYLGSCTTYLIGLTGTPFLIEKFLKIDQTKMTKAQSIYTKFGSWSLLLTWLPIIGDPLCLIGGALRVNFSVFSILVFIGKFARYAVVAGGVKMLV